MNKHKVLGDLMIFPETHEICCQGKKITLRKKEFELLEFFLKNKEKVLNRLTILEYVWNYSTDVATNTLEVHMGALRRKLDGHRQPDQPRLLQTIHGLGYKLCDRID